jgi:hypothetical protein
MPIDLSPITRFVEGEMTDQVTIARGQANDIFDNHTGKYTSAPDVQLYQGKALVLVINAYPNETPEGGGTASYLRYTLYVPLTCPPLMVNDYVILDVCMRDPQINDTVFTIVSVDRSSMQAARTCQMEQREFAGQISL